jgi:uncharacterized protein YjbI with pentapeptide repeats
MINRNGRTDRLPHRATAGLSALALFPALMALSGVAMTAPAEAADCGATADAGIDWAGCNKASLMLSSSTMTNAKLDGANLSATDLGSSDLSGATLEKAVLIRTSLHDATATKANFARIEAYRANLSGIKAQGASFYSAELQRANLSEADLTGADFSKAELSRTNFAKSTLTGVRFSLANLARAKFAGTTFEGPIAFDNAFLFLTRIEGLDLSEATGLTQEQVAIACGDAKTTLPAGLTAPANWPCQHD